MSRAIVELQTRPYEVTDVRTRRFREQFFRNFGPFMLPQIPEIFPIGKGEDIPMFHPGLFTDRDLSAQEDSGLRRPVFLGRDNVEPAVIPMPREQFKKIVGFEVTNELIHEVRNSVQLDALFTTGQTKLISSRILAAKAIIERNSEINAELLPRFFGFSLEELKQYVSDVTDIGRLVDNKDGQKLREVFQKKPVSMLTYVIGELGTFLQKESIGTLDTQKSQDITAVLDSITNSTGADPVSDEYVAILNNAISCFSDVVFFRSHPYAFAVASAGIHSRAPLGFWSRFSEFPLRRWYENLLVENHGVSRDQLKNVDVIVYGNIRSAKTLAKEFFQRRDTRNTIKKIAGSDSLDAYNNIIERALSGDNLRGNRWQLERLNTEFGRFIRHRYDVIRCRVEVASLDTFDRLTQNTQNVLNSFLEDRVVKAQAFVHWLNGDPATHYLRLSEYEEGRKPRRRKVNLHGRHPSELITSEIDSLRKKVEKDEKARALYSRYHYHGPLGRANVMRRDGESSAHVFWGEIQIGLMALAEMNGFLQPIFSQNQQLTENHRATTAAIASRTQRMLRLLREAPYRDVRPLQWMVTDFDGLLFNTKVLHDEAWDEVFREAEIDPSLRSSVYTFKGNLNQSVRGMIEAIQDLPKDHGLRKLLDSKILRDWANKLEFTSDGDIVAHAAQIIADYKEQVLANFSDERIRSLAPMINGVFDFFKHIPSEVAIASSSRRSTIERIFNAYSVQNAEIADFFKRLVMIIGEEDVAYSKPSGEFLSEVLSALYRKLLPQRPIIMPDVMYIGDNAKTDVIDGSHLTLIVTDEKLRQSDPRREHTMTAAGFAPLIHVLSGGEFDGLGGDLSVVRRLSVTAS